MKKKKTEKREMRLKNKDGGRILALGLERPATRRFAFLFLGLGTGPSENWTNFQSVSANEKYQENPKIGKNNGHEVQRTLKKIGGPAAHPGMYVGL